MCVCVFLSREWDRLRRVRLWFENSMSLYIGAGGGGGPNYETMKLFLSARIGGSCHYFISTDLKGPIRNFH